VRGQDTIDIWRVDLTDLNPEKSAQKLIYSTREQMQPRYSQDGTRIAFQSNRSGRTEIWVSDAQGGEATRATSFDGPYTSAPSWCSDGRRIAFDSRASGVSAVYIEDITERLPRTLDTSHHNLSLPVWSADCKWIFASDGRAALYRIPAAGGPAQRFTDLPAIYSSVSGTSVIFAVTEPTGVVLWAKPVDGGAERRVDNMPKLHYADAWATNATGIVYTDSSTRPISVNHYTFADRTSRKIMTVKNAPVPGGASGFTVSADGRWLLISEVDDAQSDIMLGPSP
jgi:Tol biopolymer transport system component